MVFWRIFRAQVFLTSVFFLLLGGSASSLAAAADLALTEIVAVAPSHPGTGSGSPFRPRRSETSFLGTAVRNVDTGEEFPSIQAAIDDLDTAAGDVLEVVALQLDEGQVRIDKSITLRGATGGEVIRMAVDTGSVGDDRGWFVVEPGIDLHVRDLTFDGNGFLVYQAFRHQGTGSFEDCFFRDIQFNPSGPEFAGYAIAAFGGNVDVTRCVFEQIGRVGILLFGNGIFGASMTENLYFGKGAGSFLDYAIEAGAGAVVTVSDNVATDCIGIASDGSTSAAFVVSTLFGAGTGMIATRNSAVGNHTGFAVGTAGDSSVVNAEFNRIVGNTRGLHSESPSTVAENNWWGCNTGPNTVGCDTASGTVDPDPWLALGLSASPSTVVVGGGSQLTADLTMNSDGSSTMGAGKVPNGISVVFDATSGTVAPPTAATVDGTASAQFTAGPVPGVGTASATVDNQTVVVELEIASGGQPTLFIEPEIGARPGSTVDVPVEFTSGSDDIVAVAFSVDFDAACLGFDPTDSDLNGVPDAIDFHLSGLPDPPVLSVFFDPTDSDGELDFAIADFSLPFTPFPDGALVTVTFETLCSPAPGTSIIAPVLFSDDPGASFGNPNGQSVAGSTSDGSVEIFGTLAGDCNGDGKVGAADLSACTLEVFDGDGSFWLDTPGGTFPGNPTGCDANADTQVDAGDISCKVLLIFNGQGACTNSPRAPVALGILPSLGIPAVAATGGRIELPVFFDAAGHDINSLLFAIEFDPALLGFDPEDADGNGIPDAIRLAAGPRTTVLVASGDRAGEIRIGLLDPFGTIEGPEGQAIATIELEVLGDSPPAAIAVRFAQDPEASFGSLDGRSVAGRTEDGSVVFGAIFLDGFESGDVSRWTDATGDAP